MTELNMIQAKEISPGLVIQGFTPRASKMNGTAQNAPITSR